MLHSVQMAFVRVAIASLLVMGFRLESTVLPRAVFFDSTDELKVLISQIRPAAGDESRFRKIDEHTTVPTEFPYNGTNAVAACLVWMDDYKPLIEWIAYHYQVLPLRNLVIYRDPKSQLDPTPILDRWRPFIQITYWTNLTDLTMVPKNPLSEMQKIEKQNDVAFLFFEEQREVYKNGLAKIKKDNWTWTYVGDTDEFLSFNHHGDVPNAYEKMREHGIFLKTLLAVRDTKNSYPFKSDFQRNRWGNKDSSCIVLPRFQYLGFSSERSEVWKDVPVGFNPMKFETLSFLKYDKTNKWPLKGKSVIDVSKYQINENTTINQHRILLDECDSKYGYKLNDIFRVNHHSGSWNHFQRLSDRRKESRLDRYTEEQTKGFERISSEGGDISRLWLQGFVDHMGLPLSLELLEGLGYGSETTILLEPKRAGESPQIKLLAEPQPLNPFQAVISCISKVIWNLY